MFDPILYVNELLFPRKVSRVNKTCCHGDRNCNSSYSSVSNVLTSVCLLQCVCVEMPVNAEIAAFWLRFHPKRLNSTTSGSRGNRTHNLNIFTSQCSLLDSRSLIFFKAASRRRPAAATHRLQRGTFHEKKDSRQPLTIT